MLLIPSQTCSTILPKACEPHFNVKTGEIFAYLAVKFLKDVKSVESKICKPYNGLCNAYLSGWVASKEVDFASNLRFFPIFGDFNADSKDIFFTDLLAMMSQNC